MNVLKLVLTTSYFRHQMTGSPSRMISLRERRVKVIEGLLHLVTGSCRYVVYVIMQ